MPTIEQSRKRAIDEKLQAHRISDTEFRVYNPSKHTSYSVTMTLAEDGTPKNYHCDCPFMTKGSHVGTQGVCKHMTRVIDKMRGCAQGTVGSKCRAGNLCASCRFDERMR